MSTPTVLAWRNRHDAGGIGALVDLPRSGRPPVIDEAAVITRTLNPPPAELGVTHWSARLLAKHLSKAGMPVSFAGIARIWRDWGLQPHRIETFKFLHRPAVGSEDPRRRRSVPRPPVRPSAATLVIPPLPRCSNGWMTSTIGPIVVGESARDPRDPLHRIGMVLDEDSWHSLYEADTPGVSVARGTIEGSETLVYCTDGRHMGGALGADGSRRIVDAIDLAQRLRCPIIGIWHSGGARLADGVESLNGIAEIFGAMVRASGRVPQISIVVGPAAGGAAYGPALTDVIIMSRAGRVFVTGPDIVRTVTGEDTNQEQLGGPETHGKHSGVVHVVTDTDTDAYQAARRLVGLLARPGQIDPALARTDDDLAALLPGSARRAYDIRLLARSIVDPGGFEELQGKWAPNIVVGLGRLTGRTVGVIANNPLRKGGCLDSLSAEKAARFVRMCDSFGVPLVVLVDVPGYLPGVGQEIGGVVRRGAKLLHAFAEASVPRVTLVVRKSYGGAFIAMNSRGLGATKVFAWPHAEVGVMEARAAVGVLHRKTLAAAPENARAALADELVREYELVSGGVARAMSLGLVDEVIDGCQTRRRLAEALAEAPDRRGFHSNIPL